MEFDLGNMNMTCNGEPLQEFEQADLAATTLDMPEEMPLPPMPPRSVTLQVKMKKVKNLRKHERRMRAQWRQREARIWRRIARILGWTTKRMRRRRKSSLLMGFDFVLFLEIDRNFRFEEQKRRLTNVSNDH
jgi:hypothetical protein